MDFHPALLGCRVKYHHGEVRAAINGKGGKLQLNHTKLRMIRSFPCFEFWLLLHFGYTRASYAHTGTLSAADQVVRDLRQKDGMRDYAKGSVEGLFQKLCGDADVTLNTACIYGDRTLVAAEAEGNANPSTELQYLIRELRKLGSPERVR